MSNDTPVALSKLLALCVQHQLESAVSAGIVAQSGQGEAGGAAAVEGMLHKGVLCAVRGR